MLLKWKNLPQCFILLFGRLTMHILLRILVPLHVVYLLRFVCSNKDSVPVWVSLLFLLANKWIGNDTVFRFFIFSHGSGSGELHAERYYDANVWNIASLELTLKNINLWNNGRIMIGKCLRNKSLEDRKEWKGLWGKSDRKCIFHYRLS